MFKNDKRFAQVAIPQEQKKECQKCRAPLRYDAQDEYWDCINHHCNFSISNIELERQAALARLT